MSTFHYNDHHIKEQFIKRYPSFKERYHQIFDRLKHTLENNTPEDWRFTESPHSRFFVIDIETNAKFLGFSYRHGKETLSIVDEIKKLAHTPQVLYQRMNEFVDRYIQDVLDPDLPINHEIRTVYGKRAGEIGEEKIWYEEARQNLYHILPAKSKKIAARPNAVITEQGTLWVRQYLNWINMKPGSKEYYLFQPLTKHGIDRNQYTICVYTENGDIHMRPPNKLDCNVPTLSTITKELFKTIYLDPGMRAENYWFVPTFLDRRFIDLEFKERYARKNKPTHITDKDILELNFISLIIQKAKEKLYKK